MFHTNDDIQNGESIQCQYFNRLTAQNATITHEMMIDPMIPISNRLSEILKLPIYITKLQVQMNDSMTTVSLFFIYLNGEPFVKMSLFLFIFSTKLYIC